MRIGVPREIKTEEYRVGLTPDSVFELTQHGHRVLHADRAALARDVPDTDLLIGAVLIPGATTPRLVSRDWVRRMRPGSVSGAGVSVTRLI